MEVKCLAPDLFALAFTPILEGEAIYEINVSAEVSMMILLSYQITIFLSREKLGSMGAQSQTIF